MMHNAVIPLHPRQNCHLCESPQHLLCRPTRSPKGSLDHTKVAADNEQACSPRGEEGREQAESRQGWGARGPSHGSLGAQQAVARPRHGVTVPTVPLAKSTVCSLGVQSPGLSPARDGSREAGLSQHPASRQELHGCNHTAVGARSQAAGSPRHRVSLRDMAQAELGCSRSMPQCQGDGLAPHTPWLWGPCLQAAHRCQCRAGRRQGTGRGQPGASAHLLPALPASSPTHVPYPCPVTRCQKREGGGMGQTSCGHVSYTSELAGPGTAACSPLGCIRARGCWATCPGQMAGGPRGAAGHGAAWGTCARPCCLPCSYPAPR